MVFLMQKYIKQVLASFVALGILFIQAKASTTTGQISIHIKLSNDDFGETTETFDLYPLEEALEQTMGETVTWSEHTIGGGYFIIQFHADNVKTALDRAKSTFSSHEFLPNSFIQVTYTDKRTERIDLPLPRDH